MALQATVASRDTRVDALKGFAILCVVTYHAAGQYFTYSPATGVVYAPWALWLRACLFSFMLPLFAFLSGYVLGRPGGFRPRHYFVRRTLGLLVPYVAWESIYGPWRDKHPEMLAGLGAFLGYYVQIFADPHWEGRMWYLYVLWIALMVLGIVRLAGDKTWLIAASVPLVYVAASFGQFHWLRWVYAFVAAGLIWRRHERALRPRMNVIGWTGLAAFAGLWWLVEPEQLASQRVARWFGSAVGEALVAHALPVLSILAGLSAVAALVAVSFRLHKAAEHGLAYLGVLSMGIYVTHFHFVEMWKAMPAWFLPLNVAIALAIAVALTLALGAWRVSATVLLGERWVPRGRALGDVRTETL